MISEKRLSQVRSTLPPMSQRKGSHVGVIISFAVFITFLIFLFLILEPSLRVGEEKEATLENIKVLLFGYLDSELNTISVDTNQGGSCIQLNGLGDISNSLMVKNANGNILNYDWISAGNLKIENFGGDNFFKIYESDAINPQETSLGSCTTSEYSLGLVKTEEDIFERNIINAIQLYKTNYTLLKQNVGVSSEEFGFDFIYENGTVLSTGEINQKTNVYAKEFSVNYIDTSLNSNAGSIIIKTW